MSITLQESKASALVLNQIFKRIDDKWEMVWDGLKNLIPPSKLEEINSNQARFHFDIAVISLNLRTLFELLPKESAERLIAINFHFFQKQFKTEAQSVLVINTLRKFMDAYNAGLLKIENPVIEMAKYLYFNLGLENTRQAVVDKAFFAPDPDIVQYLTHTLSLFSGFWEVLILKYELEPDQPL